MLYVHPVVRNYMGTLSLFLGFASAVFTVAANLFMGFPGLSAASAWQTFVQMILNCLFLYIAVMPVIAAAARIPNGHLIGAVVTFVYGYGGMFAAGNMTLASLYPITASMGLIRYRSYDEAVHWNTPLCGLSMMAAFLISAVIVATAKNASPAKLAQKRKKVTAKKVGERLCEERRDDLNEN